MNNSASFSFYFQHVPKVGGSIIFDQLPKEYVERHYGLKHFDDCFRSLYSKEYTRIVKDHIGLDDAVKVSLIKREELETREIIVFWRDPIDRFISTCNHFKLTPENMINFLKYPHKDCEYNRHLGRYAFYSTTSDLLKVDGKRVKTTDLRLDQYDKIIDTFAKHGIEIKNYGPANTKKNVTVDDLTEWQMKFVKHFYAEDIDYFFNLN